MIQAQENLNAYEGYVMVSLEMLRGHEDTALLWSVPVVVGGCIVLKVWDRMLNERLQLE
jgi:hypothetical protein